MEPRDKISKSSWMLAEGIKDSLLTNITQAIRGGQVKIETAQQQVLFALLVASVEEGYHKGQKNFLRSVDEVIEPTKKK